MPYDTTILLEGFWFPEAPRWHDDKLWFSDMQGLHVMKFEHYNLMLKLTLLLHKPVYLFIRGRNKREGKILCNKRVNT